MLPAPARIASTPRHSGRTSWIPAVPPPPVPGAAVGNELADGLGDGDRRRDGGRRGLGVAAPGAVLPGAVLPGLVVPGAVLPGLVVPGAVLPGLGVPGAVLPGLVVPGAVLPGPVVPGAVLEVVARGVPPAEMAGVAERVPPGENDGGVVDGEPDVHADTDAVASTAPAAQPRTVPRKRRRP